MDIVIRILIGLILFGFVGWVTYFLFGVLELVFNGTAYAFGRGVRKALRLNGSPDGATGLAFGAVTLAKSVYGFAIFAAIFLYSFFYPSLQTGSNIAIRVALASLLLLWAPSVFVLGILGFASGGDAETVSIATYRKELAGIGIMGAEADALVQHFQASGSRYYVTEANLARFEEDARAAGLQAIDYVPLLQQYAETGERPSLG